MKIHKEKTTVLMSIALIAAVFCSSAAALSPQNVVVSNMTSVPYAAKLSMPSQKFTGPTVNVPAMGVAPNSFGNELSTSLPFTTLCHKNYLFITVFPADDTGFTCTFQLWGCTVNNNQLVYTSIKQASGGHSCDKISAYINGDSTIATVSITEALS